jgi:hypothetical protein
MKFTFNVNMAIQVVGTVLHVLNLATSIFPEGSDAKAKIMLAVAIAQSISAGLAHFKNPDGTPAADPYQK